MASNCKKRIGVHNCLSEVLVLRETLVSVRILISQKKL